MKYAKFVLGILVVLSFLLVGCQPKPQELKTVRVGLMPYLDWQPLVVGDKLGYYAQEGIKLEITYFPDDVTVGQAVEAGNVDIGVGNSGSAPLLHSRYPDLVRTGFDATWRGSAIMARGEDITSGKWKTYKQFYDENVKTMSPADADKAALASVCGQLKGASVVMDRGTSNASRLAACFPPASISFDDIKVIDMPDSEGALAFLTGTGDFEIGGYPQVLSIEAKGGQPIVTGIEMGGPSILVSDEYATKKYVDANFDTVVAMRRVWYKVIDEMYSNPDKILPILADIITKASGTTFTTEAIWPDPHDLNSINNQITLWPRLQDVNAFYFDQNSRTYWKPPYDISLDYWVNVDKEVKAGTVNTDDFGVEVKKIIDAVNQSQNQ